MKASQSSIYREVENLLIWCQPVIDRLPKNLTLQRLGERVIDRLVDSLDVITLALQSSEGNPRLQYIDILILNMTSVKVCFRMFEQYSLKSTTRIVTARQYAQFLKIVFSISVQTVKWRKKNTQSVEISK